MSKPLVNINLPETSQVGFSRPGVSLWIASIVVLILVPWIAGALRLDPEPLKIVGGITAITCAILYFVGCRRYLRSKGYESFWLALWLTLGSGAGFLALLWLPDLQVAKKLWRSEHASEDG